jgi:hypothetical protein
MSRFFVQNNLSQLSEWNELLLDDFGEQTNIVITENTELLDQVSFD